MTVPVVLLLGSLLEFHVPMVQNFSLGLKALINVDEQAEFVNCRAHRDICESACIDLMPR